jgi:GT2 family glycosyltransferase
VNWNTCQLLDECISSIQEASPEIECEIIVVDNASSDNSLEMLKEKHPDVILIANMDNPGFARANNQAYIKSTGRYFMLLNPDTVCLPGSLAELVHYMDANPSIGVSGPLVLNPDYSLQYSWAKFPAFISECTGKLNRMIMPQRTYPKNADEARRFGPFLIDWVGGCAFVARRDAIEQIGLLDDSLFMYSEETDWCRRFHNAGWKISVDPQSEIIHLGGQSSIQVADNCVGHLFNSKVMYFRKHHGRIPAAILAVTLGLVRILRRIKYVNNKNT